MDVISAEASSTNMKKESDWPEGPRYPYLRVPANAARKMHGELKLRVWLPRVRGPLCRNERGPLPQENNPCRLPIVRDVPCRLEIFFLWLLLAKRKKSCHHRRCTYCLL